MKSPAATLSRAMREGDSRLMLPDSSSTSTTRTLLSVTTKLTGSATSPLEPGSGAPAGFRKVVGQAHTTWSQQERLLRQRDCSVTSVGSWLPPEISVKFAELPWPQQYSVPLPSIKHVS